MTPLELALVALVVSVAAGCIGSLLGLGGGAIVVPVLTLGLGVPIELAVGASIVSVIATSSGAGVAFVRDRMANLKLGTFLQVTATMGGVTGAYLAGLVGARVLFVVFGAVLGYSAWTMLRQHDRSERSTDVPPDPIATRLGLGGEYHDAATGRDVRYDVTRTKAGLGLMYVAGLASGLLGIGSGALKVPAMDVVMRVPMKASSATSNFMIGLTAASSAGLYLVRGDINPVVAAPVAVGVLAGSLVGARWLKRIRGAQLRLAFIVVLAVLAVQMVLKGAL